MEFYCAIEAIGRQARSGCRTGGGAIRQPVGSPLGDPVAERWWQRLRAWDGDYQRGPLPAVFERFERELRRAVFEDDAGKIAFFKIGRQTA